MSEDERETSDLFSLRSTQVKRSIMPVEEVLTPPEELRKQRIRKIVLAVVTSILALITAYTIYHFIHEASIESAVIAAGESGRVSDVQEALETLGSSEYLGLQARLKAMLALSGELPIEEAQAAIEAVPDDPDEASERFKAEVYVGMARGDIGTATAAAGRLLAVGTYAGETAYAKSLAAWVVGNASGAASEAQVSRETHESAPRYLSQLALATALAGDVDGALEALAPAGEAPAARTARARILSSARREGALTEADAVLADDTALAAEKAWAKLVRAEVAAWEGRRARAREAARAAAETPPPGDVLFHWQLAHVYLMADDPAAATETLRDLDSAVADPALAGRVNAWLLLTRNDPVSALRALAAVPASPEAFLLVGRAHAMRDETADADAKFQQAGEDERYAARALGARAELKLAGDDAPAAVLLARQALEAAPHHPALVPIAVRALLATDAADDALEVARAALEQHADDDRILEAVTDAYLAKGEFQPALEHARLAVEQDATNADYHAKRGIAAKGVGELAEARTAFEAALERAEAHPEALVGLLEVDVEQNDVAHAATMIERIEAADIDTDEVTLLRTRYLVASGAGVSGTRYVMSATRRRGLRRNGYLRRAMAELYLQGEFFRQAVGMYEQARRLGENEVEMKIGRAMAHALDRKTNLANTAIGEALDAARPEGADESTPSPALENPRLLATRARMELNLGRFPSAERYAERALAAQSDLGEAHLVLGEIAIRRRRNPTEHLQAALDAPRPQPVAAALLARRLGSTEQGCALAARYLRAASRAGEHVDSMESLRERCGNQ